MEVWQRFPIKDEGVQILMKLLNTNINKRVFRKEWILKKILIPLTEKCRGIK
jgi:hypothetical protein